MPTLVAKTQPVFTTAEEKHGDGIWSEVEKSSFNFFCQAKGATVG